MDKEFDISNREENNDTIKQIIFNEKKWHKNRYPKIRIKSLDCSKCGECIGACPVNSLEKESNGHIIHLRAYDCIHCFNCIVSCPSKAIYLEGDLDKAQKFMDKMMNKKKEKPASKVYMK